MQQAASSLPSVAEDWLTSANGEVTVEEGELEEGQLSGEWSGTDELPEVAEDELPDVADAVPIQGVGNLHKACPWAPVVSDGLDVLDQPYFSSQVEFHSAKQSGGNKAIKGKKKKHKKGEGSKRRAREKSKIKYNEVLRKRKTEGKEVGVAYDSHRVKRGKATAELGEHSQKSSVISKSEVSEHLSRIRGDKPSVDDLLEDGEILVEPTKSNPGILSSLVEAEVGLWTQDDVDDQLVTQMEEDGAAKKKRGPETAERKLKRKIAKRKKRAQKERELGIRRPPRTVQSKPVKVLCMHYMKGRCAKGENCTFSHDAVPLTKQEPCKFLMSHSCLKGDDCPYSHDLGSFPCKFFHTRGLCYDGENCQFSHGAISEEALDKLQKRVEKEKKDRVSSAASVDVPTPTFSAPLPPELDPDPLGWGNPSSFTSRDEGTESLISMADPCGVFDLDDTPRESPTEGFSSGQDLPVPLSSDSMRGSELNNVMQQRIEKADDVMADSDRSTIALESRTIIDFRCKGESKSFDHLSSASTEGVNRSSISSSPPVYLLSPDGWSSVTDVLEVSKKGIDPELRVQGNVCPPSSLVSTVPAGAVSDMAGAVLRERQCGNVVSDLKRGPLQYSKVATTGRQNTVESLLYEALRH